jgi:hypothetical protein
VWQIYDRRRGDRRALLNTIKIITTSSTSPPHSKTAGLEVRLPSPPCGETGPGVGVGVGVLVTPAV